MAHILLLGGDERQRYLATNLQQRGYSVADCPAIAEKALSGEAAKANVLLLPLPATKNGVTIMQEQQAGDKITFSTLLPLFMPEKIVLGGLLPQTWIEAITRQGCRCADYYHEETVQIRNALPSAEGAICIAMQELPVTLCGTHIAVVGYGHIGALLTEKLIALGARVCVLARSPAALATAALHGAEVCPLWQGVPPFWNVCRIVFNTVPAPVLGEAFLQTLPKHCVLVELASAPGGFDPEIARKHGLRTIFAPGIPGRFYPETAGTILADAVCAILGANGFFVESGKGT